MLTTFNSGALVYNEGAASHLKHPETLENIEAPMSKPEKKVQVEFIRQTMAAGEVARVGDVATLPESEAKYLISSGKAVEAERGSKDNRQGKPKPVAAAKVPKPRKGSPEAEEKESAE